MYECESWTLKKAERQRIDAFWTVVLEKTLESPLDCKEIKPVNLKGNQSWIFIGRTDAEAEAPIFWPSEELIPWKRPWCWERLRAGGEESDRGWDGWMASPTLWTWAGANTGRYWRTGKPGVLQFMGSKRVRHNLRDWATILYPMCLAALSLYDPMDCSPPGSSVHGILQARILEWVAMPSFRGLPSPGSEPALQADFFTDWANRETPVLNKVVQNSPLATVKSA